MGRLHSKKFRTHTSAAQSTAGRGKQKAAASGGGAAAVAAAFSGEGDDELIPVDNEQSDADGEGELEGELGALSRGQRKRMKRRTAFMKKMGLVKRVVQEKAKEKEKTQHGVFADIKELQDSLFVSDKELAAAAAGKISQSSNVATKTTKPKKMSGKQRQKLAVRELGQLKAVHTHPSFKTDPFAAIQMHLQSTVVHANQENLQKTIKASAVKAKQRNDMEVE